MTDKELLESIEQQIHSHLNPPVNCELGPEEIVSEIILEDCQPDSTQRVEVTWEREIVTPPSNGGLECEATSGTRIEVRSCLYTPPPTNPNPNPTWDHTNYNNRKARADLHFAVSLRNQEQIDKYGNRGDHLFAPKLVYDPVIDAMMLGLASQAVHTGDDSARQVWFTLPNVKKDLCIVYEYRFSSDWTYENGIRVHKFTNLRRLISGDPKIWIEQDTTYLPKSFTEFPNHTRTSEIRMYGNPSSGGGIGAQDVPMDDGRIGSSGTDLYKITHYDSDTGKTVLKNNTHPLEKWVRALLSIEYPSATSSAPRVSLAEIDEASNLVRIPYDHSIWSVGLPGRFDIEVNTSESRQGTNKPEVHMHWRNVSFHYCKFDTSLLTI